MKAKAIFCLLSIGFFITSVNAYERIPKTISPGSDDGVAAVAQSCPTFSWSAVNWAETYRVAVFEAVTDGLLSYEEMEALSSQVINKEIQGRATSWTPSLDERLNVGTEYVWYVQALDVYGQGIWSEGRFFEVDVGLRFDGEESDVRKKLEEQGLGEEITDDGLEDIKSGAKDVIVYGIDTKNLNNNIQDKAGIQVLEGEEGNYTSFGLGAGGNPLYPGILNSFFGKDAGLYNDSSQSNTYVGHWAGEFVASASRNTFIGFDAGEKAAGWQSVIIGSEAGWRVGEKNTILGYKAGGYQSTSPSLTGSYNTFLGFESGQWNRASFNLFVGYSSGSNNTTGYENTFIGYRSGYNNHSGFRNTYLGNNTGANTTTGSSNLFLGWRAGFNNLGGDSNTFVGQESGLSNTSGLLNLFLGYYAGYNNTTGNSNTFVGTESGRSNIDGYFNTFVGRSAGYSNSAGDANVFLGYGAGYNETGSNKLYIESTPSSSPLIWGDFASDIVAINGQLGVGTQSPGYPMELERTGTNASIIVDRADGAMNYINATASYANFGSVRSQPLRLVVDSLWRLRLDADNSLTMKSSATCTSGGDWQNASSRELKENIRELTTEEAIEALDGLAPVKFNYKANKEEESLGFIAEEVPDLVATKNRKGMNVMDVIAVLTKVVQEKHSRNGEQQKIINELRERIENLRTDKATEILCVDKPKKERIQ